MCVYKNNIFQSTFFRSSHRLRLLYYNAKIWKFNFKHEQLENIFERKIHSFRLHELQNLFLISYITIRIDTAFSLEIKLNILQCKSKHVTFFIFRNISEYHIFQVSYYSRNANLLLFRYLNSFFEVLVCMHSIYIYVYTKIHYEIALIK